MMAGGERGIGEVDARVPDRPCGKEQATNPLHLTAAQIEALRKLRSGDEEMRPDEEVWDEIEQLGLVESRESAHHRVLTQAGRDYPTD